MTRHMLLVSRDRPGAHRTIADALLQATDGALISIAAGRYDERLHIQRVVTLAPEPGGDGDVEIHHAEGCTITVDADAVQLTGLVLVGADDQAPVVEVRRGGAGLDRCRISRSGWAAGPAPPEGAAAGRRSTP